MYFFLYGILLLVLGYSLNHLGYYNLYTKMFELSGAMFLLILSLFGAIRFNEERDNQRRLS